MRIGFLGGDARMRTVCALAKRDGHKVLACALADADASVLGADALCRECEVLVLPVPATRDGVHIAGTDTAFSALPIREDQALFGGFLPEAWQACGARVYDCSKEEPFTLKNASLTAEGAISSALRATGRGFYGVSVAVIGFGRIARQLLHKLSGFGVPVTVYARRPEALAEASLSGFGAVPLGKDTAVREDIIFNTVPSPVFDGISAPRAVYCCDLGGGMPSVLSRGDGDTLPVTAARGVPGVFAPAAAGEIIYESLALFLKTVKQS